MQKKWRLPFHCRKVRKLYGIEKIYTEVNNDT